MALNDLLPLLSRILGAVWHIILDHAQEHPWTVAVALYGLALTFGVTIQSGQRGVLFRWGRAVKELEPGFHWLVPLVHGVKKTPVRSVTIDLPDQKVMTTDGLVFDVSVNLVYRVEEATKALTLVDHLESACRAAVPIIITEVLRVLDQAGLADREALNRELTRRMQAWIVRWGLVIEQAGFTTIAPNKSVLHTTQLRARTMERACALHTLIGEGLDTETALVLIGSERHPGAKSSRRYHLRTRQSGRPPGARRGRKRSPAPPPAGKYPRALTEPPLAPAATATSASPSTVPRQRWTTE
jgi:hypothetical protein